MNAFMDRDFLLETPTARHLYHDFAQPMPLADYHCHISPREIYEDRRFEDLAEVWLGGPQADGTLAGDHYKWRLMRSNGIPEEKITGTAADGAERIQLFAKALQLAIGNPMYHWCHLELKQFFGWDKPLTLENAREVYDYCSEKLRNDPEMTVRGLIRKANVAMIGTTDDPIDTLEWHEKIAEDPTITVQVCPSFRPDRAVNLTKPGFAAYMAQLAESVGKRELTSVQEVCRALSQRLEFFVHRGCRAADHGLDYVPFRSCTQEEADASFRKAMAGEALTLEEAEGYQTALLLHLGREYARLGVVMQIHYSCLRNANARRFSQLGGDTGFDTIGQNSCGRELAALLSALDQDGCCPKAILYSLNPNDNAFLGALIGCFQTEELPGKLQHGSAWWFNDNKTGMEEQLISLANLGILGNFVGMLTDSRSFLSYARHDYFRRILCNLLGRWVENGEYPMDETALRTIVEGVSYRNAARYFSL